MRTRRLLIPASLFTLSLAAACAAPPPDVADTTSAEALFVPILARFPYLQVTSVTSDLQAGQHADIVVSLVNPGAATYGIIYVDVDGTRLAHAAFQDGKVTAATGATAQAGFRSDGFTAGTHTLNVTYQEARQGFGGSQINPHPITYYETVATLSQPLVVTAPPAPRMPTYDQVFQVSTHNSYWVNRSAFPADFEASGVQERLLDQMLFENVRAIELDIHRDDATAGRFSIYHTDNVQNSLCADLEACIQQLRMFHYALPEHEVVTVVLEFKEISNGLWNGNHHPADLDQRLRDGLGSLLYQPADFLARCAPGTTMQACAARVGWPTIDALRGKFIFTVLGTWNAGLDFTSWEQYSTDGGDVRRHAAFPMWAPFNDHDSAGEPTNDGVLAQKAINDSVFLQLENMGEIDTNPVVADLVRAKHAVARVDGTWNTWEQTNAYNKGLQMAQTDTPWWLWNTSWPGKAHPFRPMPNAPDPSQVIYEPGQRLEMAAQQNGIGRTFAYETESADAGVVTWETTPAATRTTHTATAPNDHRPNGTGCLSATDDKNMTSDAISICRLVDRDQLATIVVQTTSGGALTEEGFAAGWRTSEGAGDLLRLSVQNIGNGAGSCVTAFSASEIVPATGTPKWTSLVSKCFASPLVRQGIAAEHGDVLFTGTKRSGASVRGADFTGFRGPAPTLGTTYALIDLSWPPSP